MMKSRRGIPLGVTMSLVSLLLAPSLRAQADQHALAQQLLHGDRAARSRALAMVSPLGPQYTGPELRAALIARLDTNNRIVRDAAKRKDPVAKYEDPEFITGVAHAVSQLEDPRAIPALASALGTGSTLVRDALAAFGERATADILRVVTSLDSRYSAVDDGLIALRFMVEGRGARRLSDGTLEQIRQAAKQRLNGKQYFTTVWYAIDLAVALNDAKLKRAVDSLAADQDAVAARGIQDLELIRMTQERAAKRLAGAPASPKYRTPEERARLLDNSHRPR